MKRAIFLLAVMLVIPLAFGQDVNQTVEQRMNDLIEQLAAARADLDTAKEEMQTFRSPQIITVQLDADTKETLVQLEGRINSLDREVSTFQDKFVKLAEDMEKDMDSQSEYLVDKLLTEFDRRQKTQQAEIKEHIAYSTNPVKINAANIGLWLLLTGGFMLAFVKKRGS